MKQNMVHLIISVIKDIHVIATLIAALIIIEFAKFITTYKKKAPKPKAKKAAKPAAAPAPAPAEGEDGGGGEEAAE